MKLKIAVIGIVLIVASLSGCIGGEGDGMHGTYVCEADGGILDLYDGNQWEMAGQECSCGDYTLRHGEVRLKLSVIGVYIPLAIEGRDLVDPDGDRWVRD